MDIPDSLARRIELWRLHGRIFVESVELFGATSWIAVMLGQNIWPDRYDPVADTLDEAKVAAAMAEMRAAYRRAAERLPPQDEFLRLAGAWTADAAAEVAACSAIPYAASSSSAEAPRAGWRARAGEGRVGQE